MIWFYLTSQSPLGAGWLNEARLISSAPALPLDLYLHKLESYTHLIARYSDSYNALSTVGHV